MNLNKNQNFLKHGQLDVYVRFKKDPKNLKIIDDILVISGALTWFTGSTYLGTGDVMSAGSAALNGGMSIFYIMSLCSSPKKHVKK